MKTILLGAFAIAASLSFVGASCTPSPTPTPTPAADSGPTPPPPGDPCAAACAALRAANCGVIGSQVTCPAFMGRDYPNDGSGKLANPLTGRPMRCQDIAAVQTKADAQRLGFACQ